MITSVLQAKNLGFLRLYSYPIDSKLYVLILFGGLCAN